MKYKLTIVAIFKNEASILYEWLNHYTRQGVEHFYLIDNGSDDNWSDYVNEHPVTVVSDDRKYMQPRHYNRYLPEVKHNSEWVMVVDLDEFVYARGKYNNIIQYLDDLPQDHHFIKTTWKMFGSSGHIKQPDSVISNFTFRTPLYDKNPTKYMVKTDKLKDLHIHTCKVKDNVSTIVDNENIHLNHYAIQSWEWFRDVKMTRGDVLGPAIDKLRDRAYFDKYDYNTVVEDVELKEITEKNN